MERQWLINFLDKEIERLSRARTILSTETSHSRKPMQVASSPRKLTPEGRKRISEAVKRRWDNQRKAA